MPEADGNKQEPSVAFEAAKNRVAAWLAGFGGDARALTKDELRSYREREIFAGWRLKVQFSDDVRRLELLLPADFPWQPPRIALLDRPPFLTWPHVEQDGILCLASDVLSVDPDDPIGVATFMLGDATNLIERLISGSLDADFQDEFLSYWQWAADEVGPNFISLLRAGGPTRAIRVWRGNAVYVLAENDTELRAWLVNRFGNKSTGYPSQDAILLWLKAAPLPRDYPRLALALRSLTTGDAEAIKLLSKLARAGMDRIVTALGVKTANGPALAGLVIPAPKPVPHGARDPLTKGFRRGAVPDALLLQRYFGVNNIIRRSIERADAAWVHGRGQDLRAARLRDMTVVVIGCGSMGAPVATSLAQAGLGHLILVDFDQLKWANVGRHPLGALSVGHLKAKALAEKLRSDYPHMTIDYHCIHAETAVREHGDMLSGCDVIISATGSWSAETCLELMDRRNRPQNSCCLRVARS